MTSRILTVPNQLTFLRLAFLPVFLIAIKYERYDLALGILVAAGLSDGLDGLLARGLNQKTPLGAYLDPIADKLLLSSSYFVLALKGKIAWWLTILVLGRDVLILVACAVILITVGYRPFPPSIWGKATTFFEILLVVLVLVLAIWDNHSCGSCVTHARIWWRCFWRFQGCTTASWCRGSFTPEFDGDSSAEIGLDLSRRSESRPFIMNAMLAITTTARRPAESVCAIAFLRRAGRPIRHDFSKTESCDQSTEVRVIVNSGE